MTWVLEGVVDGSESVALLGWSVSLSGDGRTLATGAPVADGNGVNMGLVRIYKAVELHD